MKKLSTVSNKSPNFIGSWNIENDKLCNEIIKFFEENRTINFEQFATVDDVPVTRESNGFRVTNNSGAVFNNIVYAVRF